MHFYDFDFTDEMLDSLDAMRFSEPTPIQEQSIPVIMALLPSLYLSET